MNMIPYDVDYAPCPFGLKNTGVLCYFNSLSQCLLSLPSFNKYMAAMSGPIIQEYNAMRKTRPNTTGLAYDVAAVIHGNRQRNSFQWNIDPNSQEDIHEGFILMMESIDNQIERIFNVRYQLSIVCHGCKQVTTVPRESSPCDLVIDMGNQQYKTKHDVEQYIMSHSQIPDGYRCDHCAAQNTPERPIITQRYDLAKLSSVIVLLFKYNQYRIAMRKNRITQFFPDTLDFDSINGPISYKLCAYAEQYGSLTSGHYTATCLRPQYDSLYKSYKGKLNVYGADHPNVKKYKQAVQNNLSVVRCDDTSVNPGTFRPSPHTYMVFYHLC